jgi:hypothetical protein
VVFFCFVETIMKIKKVVSRLVIIESKFSQQCLLLRTAHHHQRDAQKGNTRMKTKGHVPLVLFRYTGDILLHTHEENSETLM